jgi:hypothetical protein
MPQSSHKCFPWESAPQRPASMEWLYLFFLRSPRTENDPIRCRTVRKSAGVIAKWVRSVMRSSSSDFTFGPSIDGPMPGTTVRRVSYRHREHDPYVPGRLACEPPYSNFTKRRLRCIRVTNYTADHFAGFGRLVSGRQAAGVSSAIRLIGKSPNPGGTEPR